MASTGTTNHYSSQKIDRNPEMNHQSVTDSAQPLNLDPSILENKRTLFQFYRQILSKHQLCQRQSLLTTHLFKLLNSLVSLNNLNTLWNDLIDLLNILVYPQEIKLPESIQDKQQEKVRNVIIYLQTITQILNLDQADLFTISDVIDPQNINLGSIINHLMVIFEKTFGIQIQRIKQIGGYELLDLQRDLEPLLKSNQQQSVPDFSGIFPIESSIQRASIKQEVITFQNHPQTQDKDIKKNLKKFEAKIQKYKKDLEKYKQYAKQQQNVIIRYEQALESLAKKSKTKLREQKMKNQIYEQFLSQLKVEHEFELNKLKAQAGFDDNSKSRSISPITNDQTNMTTFNYDLLNQNLSKQQIQTSKIKSNTFSSKNLQTSQYFNTDKAVQKDIHTSDVSTYTVRDPIDIENEEIKVKLSILTKEKDELLADKKNMLLDKQQYIDQHSEFQQNYQELQEQLDQQTIKYKNVKAQMKQIKNEQVHKDDTAERFKEQIQILEKQKQDVENRAKKIEQQFRSCLKEVDELRDQLEKQQQSERQINETQIINISNDDSNFSMYSMSQASKPASHYQGEMKIAELEREKDFLQTKIKVLEKSNRELYSYKKELEATLEEISKEKDQEKRLNMVDLNLIRRKSLLRLEDMQKSVYKSQESQNENNNSFLGFKQSSHTQFVSGTKNANLEIPSTIQYQSNNVNELSGSFDNDQNNNIVVILDQMNQMDQQRLNHFPGYISPIPIISPKDQMIEQNNLFGQFQSNRFEGVIRNRQKTIVEVEEEEVEEPSPDNYMITKLQSKLTFKQKSDDNQQLEQAEDKDLEKYDEYDEESSSSSSNEEDC